jgi:hypothetical protein
MPKKLFIGIISRKNESGTPYRKCLSAQTQSDDPRAVGGCRRRQGLIADANGSVVGSANHKRSTCAVIFLRHHFTQDHGRCRAGHATEGRPLRRWPHSSRGCSWIGRPIGAPGGSRCRCGPGHAWNGATAIGAAPIGSERPTNGRQFDVAGPAYGRCGPRHANGARNGATTETSRIGSIAAKESAADSIRRPEPRPIRIGARRRP